MFLYVLILYIWRISNADIEPTPLHNPIELNPPVERLVAALPLCKLLIIGFCFRNIIAVNAVLRCQVAIEFSTQYLKLLTKMQFVLSHIDSFKLKLRLELAEIVESSLDFLRFLL